MKPSADKGKLEGENNTPKQRKTSSKNGEIETYLSSYYEFRYNTVLGRTEYRGKNDAHFSKVGRYEINTLRRELDNYVGIVTSSDNLYSIIESSFSPRVNPIQEYFKRLPLRDIGNISGNNSGNSDSCSHDSSGNNENNSCCHISSLSLKALPELASCVVVRNSEVAAIPYQMARGSGRQRHGQP